MLKKPLSTIPLVHPTADVRASKLGIYTEVGARTQLLEVVLDGLRRRDRDQAVRP